MSRDSEQPEEKHAEKHFYDGIEEHDNMLPRWWLAILYGTIAFAFAYYGYYTFGPGPTLVQEYEREMQVVEFRDLAAKAANKALGEPELVSLVQQPERRTQGSGVYQSKCAACHGTQGGGGIGPNLTDAYWLHGGKLTEIARTVTEGVGDKGMPPWGPILSPDDVYSVVAYIRSIRGSNPAGAKPPQGEKVAE